MQKSVSLYGCFRADNRISMNIYAAQLQRALASNCDPLYCITPEHTLERFSNSKAVMRFLRYWYYPRVIRQKPKLTGVHHVIDHGYAHLYPSLPSGKKVVTAHDLIPLLTWKGIIPSQGKVRKPRLNLHSLSFLEKFDTVIAPSVSTANDLQRFLGFHTSKIKVIPPVIADHFQIMPAQQVTQFRRRITSDEETKLILITGREHYKNLVSSIKVVKNLLKNGNKVKLVRTGYLDTYVEELLRDNGISDHVESLFFEDHKDLVLLYNAVDCLLFPSWYEGFGMPVAEALACGTPVVSSNTSSLPEVGGQLALSASPNDIDALTDLVLTCLFDKNHQIQVLQKGPEWVEQFRSSNLISKLHEAYGV